MPDTLAHPWGWKNIPEWERMVLKGVADEITGLSDAVSIGLRQPDDRWSKRYWYGIEVWMMNGYFDSRLVGFVYVHDDMLIWGTPTSREVVFEIANPDSIPRLLDCVRKSI